MVLNSYLTPEQFAKGYRRSSPMQDLQQPQIIRSGVGITGERSGAVLQSEFQSVLPGITGKQFGKLTVISDTIWVTKEMFTPKQHLPSSRKRKFALTICECGEIAWKNWDNLRRRIAGCRICDKPRRAPLWLVQRATSAKNRCENPNDPRFADYGGRGIRFCFKSPTDMAVWLMQNFDCSNRKLQIDRINNNANYEPGNIRMTTPGINMMNRRRQNKIKMLRFRLKHPEIRYADATLCRLFGEGLTEKEIIERFYRPSAKPKGVYGTFSTPDPAIVSQLLVY